MNVIMKVANGTSYWILTFHIKDVFSMLYMVVVQNQRSFNPSRFPFFHFMFPPYKTSTCS